jgi:hypothetical protein
MIGVGIGLCSKGLTGNRKDMTSNANGFNLLSLADIRNR